MSDIDHLKDPALQQRLRDAASPEEILRIASEEGYELTDEELSGIAGGGFWSCDDCPSDYHPQPMYQNNTMPENNGISV